jgi:hypothetical protein
MYGRITLPIRRTRAAQGPSTVTRFFLKRSRSPSWAASGPTEIRVGPAPDRLSVNHISK